jgi:hypothetical protein
VYRLFADARVSNSVSSLEPVFDIGIGETCRDRERRTADGSTASAVRRVTWATLREAAANVEPYLRADGTRIWS